MAVILLQIGIIYFLGHLFAYTFKKYKVPDVLIFILLGLLIGPGLGWVKPEDFGGSGQVLSALALIVILFESGTTLDMKSLAAVALKGSTLALVTAIFTGILAALFSYPFAGSVENSILIGVILAGTSSAVVIPMTSALGISNRFKNICILESALTDVLCIVLVLALIKARISGSFDVHAITGQLVLSFAVAIVLGVAAGILWTRLKTKLIGSFATVAFAIVVYGAIEMMGFSGPIAVMALGVSLANAHRFRKEEDASTLSPSESAFYTELVFVLKTFFFIYLGISMQLENVLVVPVAALFIGIVIVLRAFLVKFLWRKESAKKELAFATLLVPKGMAAAVLASVPAQAGLEGTENIPQFVFPVVLISIIIVSLLIPVANAKIKGASSTS